MSYTHCSTHFARVILFSSGVVRDVVPFVKGFYSIHVGNWAFWIQIRYYHRSAMLQDTTSHPRIAHGQRYPMPCLE